MLKSRWMGFILLFLVLLLCTGLAPWAIYAQATAGYTKISTTPVATTTFTTGTLTNGAVYNFEVTAVDATNRESIPSNVLTLTIPTSGTHTVTLNWIPSTSAGVNYNVYNQLVPISNPPGALSGVVNP